MEGREGLSSGGGGGVTVVSSDAPTDYPVVSRLVTPPERNGQPGMSPVPAMETVKKKRGRPRKYRPGETPSTAVMSPKPISSAAPLPAVIDFSTAKRAKVRPVVGSESKLQSRVHLGNSNLGELVACSVGVNFTPHIITVSTGEDITKKVISFSQQGPRAICILSATGAISSVTLRQPDSSGGTLTYEGRFEILSLSGSFMLSETNGTRSRTGGMSVSLASPDGRVIGGGVAGSLVAANPVLVVVGSFVTSSQSEQIPKKPDYIAFATSTSAVPISTVINMEEAYSKQGPPHISAATKQPNLNTTPSFRGDSWSSLASDTRSKQSSDINVSAPGS
ncbi:unnamed protein product [Rhodiola kirilowii]